MATIYSRIDKNSNKRYYGSIYHNGKRTRKSLGCSKQSAEALMKELEYKLLFNIQISKLNLKFLAMKKLFFLSKKR